MEDRNAVDTQCLQLLNFIDGYNLRAPTVIAAPGFEHDECTVQEMISYFERSSKFAANGSTKTTSQGSVSSGN